MKFTIRSLVVGSRSSAIKSLGRARFVLGHCRRAGFRPTTDDRRPTTND
jgi:hypothetical protein